MIAPVATPTRALRGATALGLALLLIGFVSIVWTPYPVDAVNIAAALADPSGAHWLGTDQLGRDALSMLMRSLLTSFIVAGVGVAISAIIGIPLGALAATSPVAGRIVAGIDRFLLGFPAILFAMLLVATMEPGSGVLMLALGLCGVPAFAKVAAQTLTCIEGFAFVDSARLAGMSASEIWRRHTIPDFARVMLATGLGLLGPNVLLEAALSFVGLGAQAPASSFGLMLHDAQTVGADKPLLLIVPGLLLTVTALTLGVANRGLAALADPRLDAEGNDAA